MIGCGGMAGRCWLGVVYVVVVGCVFGREAGDDDDERNGAWVSVEFKGWVVMDPFRRLLMGFGS